MRLRIVCDLIEEMPMWGKIAERISDWLESGGIPGGVSADILTIFREMGEGRGQSGVSRAGSNWKRLTCVALNLQLAGTDTIFVPGGHLTRAIPDEILEKLKVGLEGKEGVFSSPEAVIVHGVPDKSYRYPFDLGNKHIFSDWKRHVSGGREAVDLTVPFCKTNFKDNIQTPMLWAYLREQQDASIRHVWITVPTNSNDNFMSHHSQVVRARAFSNGAFWGLPTMSCESLRNLGDFQDHIHPRPIRSCPAAEVIGEDFYSAALRIR